MPAWVIAACGECGRMMRLKIRNPTCLECRAKRCIDEAAEYARQERVENEAEGRAQTVE